jgi:hypothetical protein
LVALVAVVRGEGPLAAQALATSGLDAHDEHKPEEELSTASPKAAPAHNQSRRRKKSFGGESFQENAAQENQFLKRHIPALRVRR